MPRPALDATQPSGCCPAASWGDSAGQSPLPQSEEVPHGDERSAVSGQPSALGTRGRRGQGQRSASSRRWGPAARGAGGVGERVRTAAGTWRGRTAVRRAGKVWYNGHSPAIVALLL